MKSPAKSSSSSKTKNPSFFKVLVTDHFITRLRIPPAFARKYGESVHNRFVILVSKYGYWKVHLIKVDGDFYFFKGWDIFVKDHVLKFGDFLVFKYVGTSTFKVKVFDSTCCEKQAKVDGGKSFVRRKDENALKREDEIVVKREAENFSSKNPFFIVVMTYAKVKTTRFLDIPSAFFNKYMKKVKPRVELEVSGNVWTVKLSVTSKGTGRCLYGKLYGGWNEFVKANRLKARDACVFEMVKSERGLLFKVHIFRC